MSLSLPFRVLGYRVTGAVLVCGVPRSPGGPGLHVMVSMIRVHSWNTETHCRCTCGCVCVIFGVEAKVCLLFQNHYDSVVSLPWYETEDVLDKWCRSAA